MKKICLIILLIYNLGNADDISNLISKIKVAKISEKRLLINQLKLKLRGLNSQKRLKIINELKVKHYQKRYHSYKDSRRKHSSLKYTPKHIPKNQGYQKKNYINHNNQNKGKHN
jgi:hypothetical protein